MNDFGSNSTDNVRHDLKINEQNKSILNSLDNPWHSSVAEKLTMLL